MAHLLNTVPADTSVDLVAEVLQRDGYIIIERLAPGLVSQAMKELKPHIEATNTGNTFFEGEKVRNLEGLVTRSAAAHELMIHPTILSIADQTLLPYCVRYQLNWTSCRHLEPGCESQYLHRDNLIYPFQHPHPPTQLATMWAGTNFTGENGGTLIVPGSHQWEEERKPQKGEVLNATMSKGSVLLYTSGLLHGGGENRTREPRTGIAIQYSLGWLRQEENLHLAIPPERAKQLPERLQDLVGYDFGAPYLGFVNGDDPGRLLGRYPERLPNFSRPEIDEAAAKLKRLRLDEVNPTKIRFK